MNIKIFLILSVVVTFFGYASCDREKLEDPHNHSLLNKNLDQIRSEIAGKWQFIRGCTNSIAGYVCNNTNWPGEDYLYFLKSDTVKRSTAGLVNMYEKATITKFLNYYYTDSVYMYELGFQYNWVMHEIKNDTLIMDEPGSQTTYYLVRK